MANETKYLIASLNHTIKCHEHISFWAPNCCGYRLAITESMVGQYTEQEVRDLGLNDGVSTLAVPKGEVLTMLSPEPYFTNSTGAQIRFYDTPGPVIDNTRVNWNALIKASLPRANGVKPKPEVFRGTRRSHALKD